MRCPDIWRDAHRRRYVRHLIKHDLIRDQPAERLRITNEVQYHGEPNRQFVELWCDSEGTLLRRHPCRSSVLVLSFSVSDCRVAQLAMGRQHDDRDRDVLTDCPSHSCVLPYKNTILLLRCAW